MENIIDLLIGKKVLYMTDAKVEVELEIKSIKSDSTTRQITPDTMENDWWGETETTHFYWVEFTTGFKKRYDRLENIKWLPERV